MVHIVNYLTIPQLPQFLFDFPKLSFHSPKQTFCFQKLPLRFTDQIRFLLAELRNRVELLKLLAILGRGHFAKPVLDQIRFLAKLGLLKLERLKLVLLKLLKLNIAFRRQVFVMEEDIRRGIRRRTRDRLWVKTKIGTSKTKGAARSSGTSGARG